MSPLLANVLEYVVDVDYSHSLAISHSIRSVQTSEALNKQKVAQLEIEIAYFENFLVHGIDDDDARWATRLAWIKWRIARLDLVYPTAPLDRYPVVYQEAHMLRSFFTKVPMLFTLEVGGNLDIHDYIKLITPLLAQKSSLGRTDMHMLIGLTRALKITLLETGELKNFKRDAPAYLSSLCYVSLMDDNIHAETLPREELVRFYNHLEFARSCAIYAVLNQYMPFIEALKWVASGPGPLAIYGHEAICKEVYRQAEGLLVANKSSIAILQSYNALYIRFLVSLLSRHNNDTWVLTYTQGKDNDQVIETLVNDIESGKLGRQTQTPQTLLSSFKRGAMLTARDSASSEPQVLYHKQRLLDAEHRAVLHESSVFVDKYQSDRDAIYWALANFGKYPDADTKNGYISFLATEITRQVALLQHKVTTRAKVPTQTVIMQTVIEPTVVDLVTPEKTPEPYFLETTMPDFSLQDLEENDFIVGAEDEDEVVVVSPGSIQPELVDEEGEERVDWLEGDLDLLEWAKKMRPMDYQ
jgi:hypothetical protein